ncbi:MAG: PilZ domain-containing protein [Deltaproteobacteria bacterium]|nr:PilZ domain-containing protein [Deltaproteobacteria bacterium]
MAHSTKNRRNHYRVEIHIPVHWRFLDNQEIHLVKDGLGQTIFKQDDLRTPIDEYLKQVIPDSPEEQIFRSLQYLDNKLDYLIEQVLLRSTDGLMVRGEIIELSASGIKFISREPIPIGTYLVMNMIIPGTIQYQINFVTEVMRAEQRDHDTVMAANIIYIDKDTQESIIKVIFQRQREDIRRTTDSEEINVD